MSNLAYAEHYNKSDYNQWEGDWELIHGSAYAMSPSPIFDHQFINLKISRQLDEKLDGCSECYAVFETDVEFSEETVVRPDSFVICYEPQDRLNKAPEIIFEVISKSTAKRDEQLKFELYQNEGVKYYILVYPNGKKAKVYKLENFKYVKIGDFTDENYTFELEKCSIDFDFNFIWRKK
ncbi:MAG: Uma2 family endonuclease [Campylobacterales bacterium]|nr:Uma2 family endonuclease [Campylobacterales bacterium]